MLSHRPTKHTNKKELYSSNNTGKQGAQMRSTQHIYTQAFLYCLCMHTSIDNSYIHLISFLLALRFGSNQLSIFEFFLSCVCEHRRVIGVWVYWYVCHQKHSCLLSNIATKFIVKIIVLLPTPKDNWGRFCSMFGTWWVLSGAVKALSDLSLLPIQAERATTAIVLY